MGQQKNMGKLFCALVLAAIGCSSGNGADADPADTTAEVVADVGGDVPDAVVLDTPGDVPDTPDTPDTQSDIPGDVAPPPPEVPVMGSITTPPEGSILPDGLDPCRVIREETCSAGTLRRCEIYDALAGDWAEDPPAMTEQAFVFDRYYDLYHDVEGQTMDFRFTEAIPAGTPEYEWSKPKYFRKYDGYGDASGWTGTAVWAAAARYQVTGTDADYERMLEKLEGAMFLYEVNGIPGMVVRSHWAMLPEGAPEPGGLWGKSVVNHRDCGGDDGHYCFPIPEVLHDRLPTYYLDGVEIDGVHYATQPYFQADASRDMYVRSLPGLMLAHELLRDGEREETVRGVMKTELSCTINRMKKGRIFNLEAVPEIKGALMAYLAGGHMSFDEGEEEALTNLDELVFYVMEQPNPSHPELFDPACPDGPPMDFHPAYELDGADPFFLLDLAGLALSEAGGANIEVPIAWSQHVSVRGADAIYMTQWALVAHYFTGDERYLDFLAQLMEEVDYVTSIHTYGALQLPKWCAPHYGPSLIYPSLYNLLARIDQEKFPVYWAMLASAARTEGKERDIGGREDALFGILYHRMVDEAIDPDRDAYVADSAAALATYGMDPNNKLEPDRNYPRNFIDKPDPEVPLEEIPAGDLAICTEPVSIMGIEIPAPGLEDDWPRAATAIPLPKRVGGAFIWQMDPWMAKREYGGVGMNEQWPMLGMTAAYWLGRSDGVIKEGEGLALAWRDIGVCE